MTPTSVDAKIRVRVYVDGETTPSLDFAPSFATGAAWKPANPIPLFDVDGYFGKKSAEGAFNINLPIPFSSRIMVTLTAQKVGVLYAIVRGLQNTPLVIDGLALEQRVRANQFSGKWKLVQQRRDAVFQPLEFVPVAQVPPSSAGGFVFGVDLAVQSDNENFLEGCWHASDYTPNPGIGDSFPGTLLSSGGEDMFGSSYYFSSLYQQMDSGLVQRQKNGTDVQLSGYLTFLRQPVFFGAAEGLSLYVRNGDTTDASGIKCLNIHGPNTNGHPGKSRWILNSWTYQAL